MLSWPWLVEPEPVRSKALGLLGVIWPGEPERLVHWTAAVLVICWLAVTGPASVPVTVSVIVRPAGSLGRSKPVPVVVSVLPVRLKFAVVTSPAVSTTLVSVGLAIETGKTSLSAALNASVLLVAACWTTSV